MRTTVRTVATALTALAALSLSGCGGDPDGDAGGESPPATETGPPEETAAETPADEAGAEEEPPGETLDVFDIGLGDCVSSFTAEEQISELTVIPCEDEHDQEVFAVLEVPDGDFPGSDGFRSQAEGECVAQFETFVGRPYSDSLLEIRWLEPTEDSWAEGDRELVCTVLDPAGPVSGTLEGSDR